MIVPGWLTIHVIGYGLASGVILGAGAYAINQHDGKIRAEEQAKAAFDRDTLRTRLMTDAINAKAAQVDTVRIATQTIIRPTQLLIDSARKHVTDTLLVQATLAKADSANKVCLLLAQTCHDFTIMAKDSMRVLGIALRQSNERALKVFAAPPERRFSWGIGAGVGACVMTGKPLAGKPCVALIVDGHLRLF
jgi:hypothetical protein